MPDGRILLSFAPDFRNVDMVRASLRGICMDYVEDGGSSGCPTFCLAVTEALTNVVKHSGSSTVEVEILLEEHELACVIVTTGTAFDPTLEATLPEGAGTMDAPEGGYGLLLMQQFADRMAYEHRDGRNILTLYKRRRGEKGEGSHADQD